MDTVALWLAIGAGIQLWMYLAIGYMFAYVVWALVKEQEDDWF